MTRSLFSRPGGWATYARLNHEFRLVRKERPNGTMSAVLEHRPPNGITRYKWESPEWEEWCSERDGVAIQERRLAKIREEQSSAKPLEFEGYEGASHE